MLWVPEGAPGKSLGRALGFDLWLTSIKARITTGLNIVDSEASRHLDGEFDTPPSPPIFLLLHLTNRQSMSALCDVIE